MSDDVLVIYKESWFDSIAYDQWREIPKDSSEDFSDKRLQVARMYKQINSLLDTLDDKSRTRLRRYIKGDTQTDIADSEKVSQPAIHYNLQNSMDKLNFTNDDLISLKQILIYGDLYLNL